MSNIIGTWTSTTEAEKLTQATLIPGVIPEYTKKGGLLLGEHPIPIAQASGDSITWNRQTSVGHAAAIARGGDTEWTSDVSYTQVTVPLKQFYKQQLLDNYTQAIHGTINNYEEIAFKAGVASVVDTIEDWLFYGDTTYTDSNQPDGLHAWAAVQTGTDLDIDEGGALSLYNVRKMLKTMKFGCDVILVGKEISIRLDQALQEAEIKSGLVYTKDEMGRPMMMFDGVPIQMCEYLVAEQAATGEGSSAMAKYSSGTKEYSMFFVKYGNVQNQDPGLSLGFGSDESEGVVEGKILNVKYFDQITDKIANGFRLWGYCNPMPGSKYSIGRIYGITDGAVTA